MSKQRSKPKFIGFGRAIHISFVCGLFVVTVIIIESGFPFNESPIMGTVFHGLWIGAAVGMLGVILINLLRITERRELERLEEQQRQAEIAARQERKRIEEKQEQERRRAQARQEQERRENQERQEQERKRNEEMQQRERDQKRCRAIIRVACEGSVNNFVLLPDDLKNANGWIATAQQHFRNTAYSPFWQAIEAAYAWLGNYNTRLGNIETHARRYRQAVQDYRKAGGGDLIPPFPVQVDKANATRAWESTANVADAVVYRAQCDAIFAQIWEQRRTTSAVIQGFANLEQAVLGMGHSIQSSVDSLTSAVRGLPGDVAQPATDSIKANPLLDQAVSSLHTERWRASPFS